MEIQQVLDMVFNESAVVLPSRGDRVALKKVSVRSLQPILNLLADVVAELRLGDVDFNQAGVILAGHLEADPAKVLKLISKHYDSVVAVMVHLVDLRKDEFLDLALDDGALVVQGALLLNRDFFTKQVAPALRLMAQNKASEAQQNVPGGEQQKTESGQTA